MFIWKLKSKHIWIYLFRWKIQLKNFDKWCNRVMLCQKFSRDTSNHLMQFNKQENLFKKDFWRRVHFGDVLMGSASSASLTRWLRSMCAFFLSFTIQLSVWSPSHISVKPLGRCHKETSSTVLFHVRMCGQSMQLKHSEEMCSNDVNNDNNPTNIACFATLKCHRNSKIPTKERQWDWGRKTRIFFSWWNYIWKIGKQIRPHSTTLTLFPLDLLNALKHYKKERIVKKLKSGSGLLINIVN